MVTKLAKYHQWLLPITLILFILEIFTLPFVVGLTYADRSEAPNQILTYTSDGSGAKLIWNSGTDIRPDGSAELDLFNAEYDNVKSENGIDIIAPGTEGINILRLQNSSDDTIKYVAVLYEINTNDRLPVSTSVTGENFSDTKNYPLPDGVNDSQVIRAVTGNLDAGRIQDFDINWIWNYYDDEAQDVIDTYLGNKAADDDADTITVGLYIVVENDNYIENSDNYFNDNESALSDNDNTFTENTQKYVTASTPKTGDESGIVIYITLMCISGIVLLLLIIGRKREKNENS
jgi:hypothetical protein